jgi:hypothetical protein
MKYYFHGKSIILQHAANEPKYFFLFVFFGHPLKVINHLGHDRNKKVL